MINGETTSKIAVAADAATIQSTLEQLDSVGVGAVTVTGLVAGAKGRPYNETDAGGVSHVLGLTWRAATISAAANAPQNYGPLPRLVPAVAEPPRAPAPRARHGAARGATRWAGSTLSSS